MKKEIFVVQVSGASSKQLSILSGQVLTSRSTIKSRHYINGKLIFYVYNNNLCNITHIKYNESKNNIIVSKCSSFMFYYWYILSYLSEIVIILPELILTLSNLSSVPFMLYNDAKFVYN